MLALSLRAARCLSTYLYPDFLDKIKRLDRAAFAIAQSSSYAEIQVHCLSPQLVRRQSCICNQNGHDMQANRFTG